MEFNKVLETRYSVRDFKPTPVEEDKVEAILNAVRLAPTAKNSQPHKIFVAKSEEALAKMDLVTPNRYGAPLAYLICGDNERACILKSNGRNFMEVDVTIVQSFMMMKATELGLGTCWIGRFNEAAAHEVFDIPANHILFGIMLIGYPSDESLPSKMHGERLSPEEFTTILER